MSLKAVWAWRIALLGVLLLAWQYLPDVAWISSRIPLLDPFQISSPVRIYQRVIDLSTGAQGSTVVVWPYLLNTMAATLLGALIGLVLGMLFALLLSTYKNVSTVLSLFISALNATPRIALIPIIVLIAGVGMKTNIISVVLVVFFISFYNAFQGGTSVPGSVLAYARLLGASKADVMWRVRLPYVVLWTFAGVPNAIAFGLITAVTAELLTGSEGMGQLLQTATTSLDASLTFAVVLLLSVVGMVLHALSERLKRRVLHWA